MAVKKKQDMDNLAHGLEIAMRESEEKYRLLTAYTVKLRDISILLGKAPDLKGMFNSVAESFRLFTGSIAATFTVYNLEKQTLQLVSLSVDPVVKPNVDAIFGPEVFDILMPISPDMREELLDQTIRRFKDLHELSVGAISQDISGLFMQSVGCNQIIACSISDGTDIAGVCTAYLPGSLPMVPDHILKPYLYMVRLAIKRIQTEEALKSSLSLLNASLESTADGILIVDRKGKIAQWNQKFADMWKIPGEVLSGRDDEKVINHILAQLADPEQFKTKVRQLYQQPEESSYDQVKFLDGRVFERYSQPQRLDDDIAGRVWSFRDITDRKRAEEAIRTSEEKYRSLVETAGAGIATIDMEGILTFVNDKLCQLTGYSREDVMGSPFADFLHKDDLPHLMEAFLTAISGTKISEMLEFRLIRKDGQCIWVHSNPEPIVIGGQVNGFSAIIYDISDRKRAELALRESEAQYRLLSEHTADIVALMDMDFKVTYQSPSGEKQRGYTSQEIIELPLEKHLTPDSLKLAMEVYFRDLAKVEADPDYNPIIVLELEYYRKDGTTFWAESKFSIIRDGSGKPVSILAEVRDITERKKAADEMSKREARFRNISAITSDIAYSCSTREDGRFSIDWMTGAAERITGYSCEEIQAQGCWRFLVIEGDQNLFDENVTGLASGSHGMCELRISHKNGGIVWIASSAECVQEPGTPGRQLLYGGLRDITDRKRAGEALQKSEAQYRLLAEHTTDFIWLMDMNLNNIYVSPSVMKRTGFTDQEMMELPLERHITPDSLKVAAEMVLEFIPRVEADSTYNPTSTFDMEYICKDGTTFWSENKFSVIRDSNGIPISILGEARDTTDRRLIEEKLLKSFESLKKTLNDAINTMVKIVETRDPYTSGHQQKVADLSTAIAREMKLEDTRIDQIRMAALIHDIGKMYVPSDILIRPGKLTDMELALIKTHAQSGYDIVKGMDFPCSVAEAVLQHHERLDGSGYPNGLKGEDTLLEAKILAVADVIEAMASHRPYRPALGIDKALEEISMYKGKLYDPDVVDTCLELFKSGKFEFKPV